MTTAVSTEVRPLMISSLDIAKDTGREHKEVMRSIRNMEDAYEKINQRKFALVEYKDAKGQSRPCYNLTKKQALFVVTKFKDDVRLKLINRWEELEEEQMRQLQQSQPAVPTSFAQALLLAAQQQEEIERQQKEIEAKSEQVHELTNKVEEMQVKVSYLDQILQSKSTMLVTQIAQDYGMSAKAFNLILANNGIQHKVNDQWILYAKYLNEGFVHSKEVQIPLNDGTYKIKYNTEWTQKGRLFLYEFLKNIGVIPLIER